MLYNLLVVDDEVYILSWLTDLLRERADPPCEVFKASSAAEAIDVMDRHRIDVLVTDVLMPGMDGIQLQKRVIASWPGCKTIFLTGHEQFHFAYEAIHMGVVDYVLKREDDERILQSVGRALRAIQEERGPGTLAQQVQGRMPEYLPVLRNQLLQMSLLENLDPDQLARQMEDLRVPLSPHGPVHMLLCRIDDGADYRDVEAALRLELAVTGLIERCVANRMQAVCCRADNTEPPHIACLLQPKHESMNAGAFLSQVLDEIQSTAASAAGATLSLAFTPQPSAFGRWAGEYQMLHTQLDRHASEEGVMLCAKGGGALLFERERLRLKAALLAADAQACAQVMDALERKLPQLDAPALYHALDATVVAICGRRLPAWGGPFDPVSALARARQDIAQLCAERASTSRSQMEEVAERVRQYVREHPGEDLSLTRIAEEFNYSPNYLSRLYSKVSDGTISDYISEVRIGLIKQLLTSTDHKIKRIAAMAGFESPAYLCRLFKRVTGVTPQQYRDLEKR